MRQPRLAAGVARWWVKQLLSGGRTPRDFLASGQPVDAIFCGWTVLSVAAMIGDWKACAECLRKGADPNRAGNMGTPPVVNIGASGPLALLRLASRRRANWNVANDEGAGYSPLMLAVGEGRAARVRLLLQSGADPDFQGMGGYTAMHCSVDPTMASGLPRSIARCMRLLHRAGARTDIRNARGATVIDLAVAVARSPHDPVAAADPRFRVLGLDVRRIRRAHGEPLPSNIRSGRGRSRPLRCTR